MKKLYICLFTISLLIPSNLLGDGTATISQRPSHIDISSATSQSAVLVNLSGYSTDLVRYRLYNGGTQYNCWDIPSGTYISTISYATGPLALGSATTGTTFWIIFERGTNITTSASYRDRIDPYSANNNTAALPAATEITTSFALTGTLVGSGSFPLTNKYVILGFNGATLVSAVSSDLTTGAFSLACPDGVTLDKIEIRTLTNTTITSTSGTYSTASNLGNIDLIASADVLPPLFSNGFPKMGNINATQADLQVSMDEAGKAYFVVVPDGATAPTVAETVAGVNYGSVTIAAAGTIDVVAGNTVYSATITGLTDKTNYDIYVVAEDDETTPNRQTQAVMVNLYTIIPPDVILNVTFETAGSLSPFTQVSVTGDQIWAQTVISGNGFAKINGFTTTANENIDWLISPAINLAAAESNMVSFATAMSFTGPAFKVMISSNFDGTFTPAGITAATWTDITSNFAFSESSYTWVPSGGFSLDGYTGNVYIAFVYESSATNASTWEVDDFRITGYLLPGSDATLSSLMVDGTAIAGFDPATLEYVVNLDPSITVVPTVTFTVTDAAATTAVTPATDLSGNAAARTTTIVVTAADGITTMTYKIIFEPIVTVANLAALRSVAPADYSRTYMVTGEVVVTGINATQRGQKYIQDASGGILIDDAGGIITTTYAVGDGITGIKGTLVDYYDMLEFVPISDPGAASSTGNTVAPQTITVAEFNANFENYEAELVKITGIDFTAADGTAVFETKKNYDVSVGTDVTVVRTVFLSTDLTGTLLPNMADVTGIAVWDFSTAKIAPRNLADLNIYSSDATLSDLKVNGSSVTGFASGTLSYNVSLTAGTTVMPTVTATTTELNATVTVIPATSLTGDAAARTAKIDVTSHDKAVIKHYSVVFSVATGVDETLAGKIRIYPVPARSDIYAENISDVTLIEIFDITGNKQITEAVNGQDQVRIPVSHLARGVYFLRLKTEHGTIMKRFIKE